MIERSTGKSLRKWGQIADAMRRVVELSWRRKAKKKYPVPDDDVKGALICAAVRILSLHHMKYKWGIHYRALYKSFKYSVGGRKEKAKSPIGLVFPESGEPLLGIKGRNDSIISSCFIGFVFLTIVRLDKLETSSHRKCILNLMHCTNLAAGT